MTTSAAALPRPTVEQVATLIRARTKDSNALEVGTFDGDTRPTAQQVEATIDQSVALVSMHLPAPGRFPLELTAAAEAVIALDAACRIEKTYWPEQVLSNRSPYALLKTEYDEALAALKDAVDLALGDTGDVGMIPVGSWTSIPHSFLWLYDPARVDAWYGEIARRAAQAVE